MFLNTNTLNEGTTLRKDEPKTRNEFREGKNPRIAGSTWQNSGSGLQTNLRWQKLRK